MKYSVCFLDDAIPVVDKKVSDILIDTDKLSSSDLKLIMRDAEKDSWKDITVRELISNLLDENKFIVSAFTNPSFYFNHNDDEPFRPEIFILDWDFGGDPTNTEIYLKQLLENSYSFVIIYTQNDLRHEIEAILKKKDFEESENRIEIFFKDEANSIDTLINKILQQQSENFSFKFGKKLRNEAVNATEEILIELGNITANEISQYLMISDDSNKDLIDFIGERYKSHLVHSNLNIESESTKSEITENSSLNVEKFWSSRLYFYPNDEDKLVRKGDIFRIKEKHYLVISADCDLAMFWHKNYGQLNCIALHSFEKKEDILDRITKTNKTANIKNKLTQGSMISRLGDLSEGPFILPFVKMADSSFEDFFAFPKEMIPHSIDVPSHLSDNKKSLKFEPLKYDYISDSTRICILSEPFLTQIVEHILNVLRGFGVPDYPQNVKDLLQEKTKGIFN